MRLSDVLHAAGVKAGTVHIAFSGADVGVLLKLREDPAGIQVRLKPKG